MSNLTQTETQKRERAGASGSAKSAVGVHSGSRGIVGLLSETSGSPRLWWSAALTSWLVIGGARFWASLDLLEYFEPSNFKRGVVFPGLKRTKRLISIRLPEQLLVRVKDQANKLT